jgi:hypothetical protein
MVRSLFTYLVAFAHIASYASAVHYTAGQACDSTSNQPIVLSSTQSAICVNDKWVIQDTLSPQHEPAAPVTFDKRQGNCHSAAQIS